MGTTSEKLTYLSGTKDKLKTVINAMGGEIDDDTFRSYPETLNDLVLKSINGEIDLFDEYPKKQSTGTNITIDGIEEGKALIELNPSELSQATTPTPDNPVAIKKVTGNNTITVCGRNLLPISLTSSTTVNDITFTNNEDGTYKLNGTASSNTYIDLITNANIILDESFTTIRFSSTPSSNNIKILVTIDGTEYSATYVSSHYDYRVLNAGTISKVRLRIDNGNVLDNVVIKPMIYKGQYDSSIIFEPYQGQTFTLRLGSLEYCAIGNYSDKFYEDNDNWYIKKNIGKVVLDGTENWTEHQSGTNTYRFRMLTSDLDSRTNGYCNINNYVTKNYSSDNELVGIYEGYLYFRIKKTTIDSLTGNNPTEKFKTYLGQTNGLIYTNLLSSIDVQITDLDLISDLNDLDTQIKSYKGQTNITQTNAELPFEITISSLKELDI